MSGEHVCPWWLIYTFDNPVRRLFHDPVKLLGPYLGPGRKAADIGCGLGFFTLGLARLVGPAGRVYALDLQEKMLAGVRRRARRAGLEQRIETRLAGSKELGAGDLAGCLDLVLAFWMLHEVEDQAGFAAQVKRMLKPGGALLVAEPRLHVTADEFAASLALVRAAGFALERAPKIKFSRAAVLRAD